MITYRGLLLGAAALTATTFALGATPALASGSGGHPPGNNGTVKIDEYQMDAGNDNDPHVTCAFSVNFFGYDSGAQHATIDIRPVAPTKGNGSFSTGKSWNVGDRTSGNQFDATVPISLTDLMNAGTLDNVSPQAKQGYHLRLEVEVTGSQGSDDKYKTFWLAPCASSASSSSGASSSGAAPSSGSTGAGASSPTGSTSSASASSSGSTVSPIATSPDASGTASSATAGRTAAGQAATASTPAGLVPFAATGAAGAPAASGTAGGAELSPSTPASAASSGTSAPAGSGSLAFTGADIAGTALLGIALIGIGGALSYRSRRRS